MSAPDYFLGRAQAGLHCADELAAFVMVNQSLPGFQTQFRKLLSERTTEALGRLALLDTVREFMDEASTLVPPKEVSPEMLLALIDVLRAAAEEQIVELSPIPDSPEE